MILPRFWGDGGRGDRWAAYSLLIVSVAVLLVALGYRVEEPSAWFKGSKVLVEVSSDPPGAWVFLDGMGNQKGRLRSSFRPRPEPTR